MPKKTPAGPRGIHPQDRARALRGLRDWRRQLASPGEGEAAAASPRLRLPASSAFSRWRRHSVLGKEEQAELDKKFAALRGKDEKRQEVLALRLGQEYLEAAKEGDAGKLFYFLNRRFPINYQDPVTGQSVLHKVAAAQGRKALRFLLMTKKCDFLLRDKKGRLPSEIAYLYGHDPAMARLLAIKERKQAAEQGIKLTRRPVPTT